MFTTHPGEPPLVHLRASHFHQAIVALAAPTSPALINTQKHILKNIFYKNYYIRNLQLHLTSSTLFYAFNIIVSRDSTNANTVYIFRCYCLPLLLSGLLDLPPFFASDWWMIICMWVFIPTRWRLNWFQTGIDATIVTAAFVSFTLRVWAAARNLTRPLGKHLRRRWTPITLLLLCGLGVVWVLIVLHGKSKQSLLSQTFSQIKVLNCAVYFCTFNVVKMVWSLRFKRSPSIVLHQWQGKVLCLFLRGFFF